MIPIPPPTKTSMLFWKNEKKIFLKNESIKMSSFLFPQNKKSIALAKKLKCLSFCL